MAAEWNSPFADINNIRAVQKNRIKLIFVAFIGDKTLQTCPNNRSLLLKQLIKPSRDDHLWIYDKN